MLLGQVIYYHQLENRQVDRSKGVQPLPHDSPARMEPPASQQVPGLRLPPGLEPAGQSLRRSP